MSYSGFTSCANRLTLPLQCQRVQSSDEPKTDATCELEPRVKREPGTKLIVISVVCHSLVSIERHGGARRDRTDDLMLAKHALSQLSYGPVSKLDQRVGPERVERSTSRLSGVRSNHLSYEPDEVSSATPHGIGPAAFDGKEGKRRGRQDSPLLS